jgi:hypothetical protein
MERESTNVSQEEVIHDDSPIADSCAKELEPMKKLSTTVTFVKALSEESTVAKIVENDEPELKILTEPIIEKLKFLSEGSPAASAVQIMAIQIQVCLDIPLSMPLIYYY